MSVVKRVKNAALACSYVAVVGSAVKTAFNTKTLPTSFVKTIAGVAYKYVTADEAEQSVKSHNFYIDILKHNGVFSVAIGFQNGNKKAPVGVYSIVNGTLLVESVRHAVSLYFWLEATEFGLILDNTERTDENGMLFLYGDLFFDAIDNYSWMLNNDDDEDVNVVTETIQ